MTASTAVSRSAGWQTVNLASPVSVQAGQTISLAWVFERNRGLRFTTGTPGRAECYSTWSHGMPATFGYCALADCIYRIYATYSPTGPELTVSGNGAVMEDGDATPSPADNTDVGSAIQSDAPVSRTFTVRNDGRTLLTLGPVTVPVGFTLTEPPSGTLAAGESDTFTIRLETAVTGVKSGEVRFANNDIDENPFNFRIEGEIYSPTAALPAAPGQKNVPRIFLYRRPIRDRLDRP